MEVDTGASLSVISETSYNSLWPDMDQAPTLWPSKVTLKTYTGSVVPIVGEIRVDVKYNGQKHDLSAVVVKGDGPNLIGRDWLSVINFNFHELHHLTPKPKSCVSVIEKHPGVFGGELGCVKNVTAKIYVDPEATPRFFRPRRVPYALREKVEQEIDRLVHKKILEPVEFSDWAAPIVPKLKPDGRVWICGDFNLTVNQVSKLDLHVSEQ